MLTFPHQIVVETLEPKWHATKNMLTKKREITGVITTQFFTAANTPIHAETRKEGERGRYLVDALELAGSIAQHRVASKD